MPTPRLSGRCRLRTRYCSASGQRRVRRGCFYSARCGLCVFLLFGAVCAVCLASKSGSSVLGSTGYAVWTLWGQLQAALGPSVLESLSVSQDSVSSQPACAATSHCARLPRHDQPRCPAHACQSPPPPGSARNTVPGHSRTPVICTCSSTVCMYQLRC
jgi:hypothetical protein